MGSSFRAAKRRHGRPGRVRRTGHAQAHTRGQVEFALEHRNLARGRGVHVLEHDKISLETPSLVSIGCVPAARMAAALPFARALAT